MCVTLVPVSRENVRAICDLRVAEEQRDLVGAAAYTVAEGHFEPGALLRCICLDRRPVGVLLVKMESPVPYLVRFMVDAACQRRGVGARAVRLLADELGRLGRDSLQTTFVPVELGSEGFWRRVGFTDTGRRSQGEPVFVLDLLEVRAPRTGECPTEPVGE